MTTHKTLEAARAGAKAIGEVLYIVEIDHATEGRCYIVSKAPMATLEIALRAKPMAEVLRLIAGHSVRTDAEIVADRETYLRENTNCERCGKKIDGNTAYSQQEWYQGMRVMAHYCDDCKRLLSSIGTGEYTELQERASIRHSVEPYTKEDY